MIRRPPSVIPLRQSDVEDVQRFLAQKLAEAKEQRVEDSSMMDDSVAENSGAQGTESSTAKGKGKGKAQMQDELVEQETQTRQTRSQISRDQRIGV